MAADLFLQSLRQPQRAVLPVRRTPDSASDVARSTLRAGFPLLYTLCHLIQRQVIANAQILLGQQQGLSIDGEHAHWLPIALGWGDQHRRWKSARRDLLQILCRLLDTHLRLRLAEVSLQHHDRLLLNGNGVWPVQSRPAPGHQVATTAAG